LARGKTGGPATEILSSEGEKNLSLHSRSNALTLKGRELSGTRGTRDKEVQKSLRRGSKKKDGISSRMKGSVTLFGGKGQGNDWS